MTQVGRYLMEAYPNLQSICVYDLQVSKTSDSAPGTRPKEQQAAIGYTREECKVTRNTDEVDYEPLKYLNYYHGFVSRQDLASLLKNEGTSSFASLRFASKISYTNHEKLFGI